MSDSTAEIHRCLRTVLLVIVPSPPSAAAAATATAAVATAAVTLPLLYGFTGSLFYLHHRFVVVHVPLPDER